MGVTIVINILLRFTSDSKLTLKLLPLFLIFALPSVACAFGPKRVKADPVTRSTLLDGDVTGIVEGCGHQPIVGFTYCRKMEGDASDQTISFIGPPSQCDQKDACVFIKVWNNEGDLVWGGSIPKKMTRIAVSWTTLLSSPLFQIDSRGIWTYNIQVFYKDEHGREISSISQGDILLRVFRTGYMPLDQVEDDPNYVWNWVDQGYVYKMTSGLRAYVGKVN